MLAVTLGHLESVRTLLNFEANVNCENLEGWTGIYINYICFITTNLKILSVFKLIKM